MTKKLSPKTLALGTLGVTGTSLGIAALLKPQPQIDLQVETEMDVQQIPQPTTETINNKVEDNTILLENVREDIKVLQFKNSGHTGNFNILNARQTQTEQELKRTKAELAKAQTDLKKADAAINRQALEIKNLKEKFNSLEEKVGSK